MQTIVGLYLRPEQGAATVQALEKAGFASQSVTVLRTMQAMRHYLGCRPSRLLAQDFGIGATIGLATYAFFGAIVAVGESTLGFDRTVALAALLVFSVLGAFLGGLLGLCFGLGSPAQTDRALLAGIRRGSVLVVIHTADEHASRALNLLRITGGQAAHVCATRLDGKPQATMHERLTNWLRLSARGLSLALMMLLFSFLDRSSMNEEVLPGLLHQSMAEEILLVALFVALIGMLVALRWEGIGGLLILGSVLLFQGVMAVIAGQWHVSVFDALFFSAGLIFLGLGWRDIAPQPNSLPRYVLSPQT